jgi:hypothetical protein
MLSLQQARDTFYTTLTSRIAQGNAARTIVVRQQLRPAVLVVANELPGASIDGIAPADTFCLRWTATAADSSGPLPLLAEICEIRYATAGTPAAASMDRGRALATMDMELIQAITASPQSAPTLAIAEVPGGGASNQTSTGTQVFWGDVVFKSTVTNGERLERTAEVEVFSYGQ